jgi:1-phosphatidylinositol-4-phosphate 5-kinase
MSWIFRGCISKKTKKRSISTVELANFARNYRFSKGEVEQFHMRFDRMSQGSEVTLDKFREHMGLLGLEETAAIADRIFILMDKSNRGAVNFEEYLEYMNILMHGTSDERAEQSFRMITLGKSERISYKIFKDWLICVWKTYNSLTGSQINADEASIKEIFKKFDINEDEQIDLQEYKASLLAKTELFEWFDLINKGVTDTFDNPLLRTAKQDNQMLLDLLAEVRLDITKCIRVLETTAERSVSPDSYANQSPMSPMDSDLLEDMPNKPNTMEGVDLGLVANALKKQMTFAGEGSFVGAKAPSVPHILKEVLRKITAVESKFIKEPPSPPVLKRSRTVSNVPSPKFKTAKRASTKSFVHWGDENWNLILNMMLGIQKGVRSAAATFNPHADLSDLDFTERCKHRLMSAKVGGSSNKICRFRDFAPHVFERIRRLYGITAEQYIKSLGVETIIRSLTIGEFSSLIGLCSTGKSGSFFYYSDDGQYLLKTMLRDEYLFFKASLKRYYYHLAGNPNTLVARFFGFHKLIIFKEIKSTKIYFVVMANVFNAGYEIDARYDLKGSTYGRTTDEDEDHTVARKDVDFTNSGEKICLGPHLKARLLEQIAKDCDFFVGLNAIDYSLLLGIHNLSSRTGSPPKRRSSFSSGLADPEHGGMKASDGSCIYFMGIIDVFTNYNTKKKIEHAWKSSFHGPDRISCIPPLPYAERFMQFIENCIV